MKPFILKSIALTFIIFIFGAIAYSTLLKHYYLSILPFILLFYFVATNLIHAFLLKLAGKSSSKFSSQYMASSFLKMFFYLAVAIVYLIFNKENGKIFIANYLLLYFVYTGFEVSEFLKVVRRIK